MLLHRPPSLALSFSHASFTSSFFAFVRSDHEPKKALPKTNSILSQIKAGVLLKKAPKRDAARPKDEAESAGGIMGAIARKMAARRAAVEESDDDEDGSSDSGWSDNSDDDAPPPLFN
jgi:hypothetical protein